MSGRAKKKTAAAPKKKANGYKMPAPIATGEVIHDTLMKKKWRIGPSIGVGGFGEIYSACQHENSPKKGSDYPFVIKIEPHENGPLFVEKHFYVRNANKDDVTKFMKSKKLTTFGMPTFDMRGTAPMTTREKSTATWCWSATGRTCGHDLGYWNITNGTQRAELIYHAVWSSVVLKQQWPRAIDQPRLFSS
ncbi:unnamed protein product [Plutella xylostella]|uniref:(diamondback moth) hypothetical protein n=1 Tax=Plutella xylostella TaxID=51655 RepID=A0A8S4FS22_PLUXY|nr:unnamed protein product [Plutella xylostella]